MIALNYRFALPADYDMAIIRRRVADRGHFFDDVAGLSFKAFLIAETGGRNRENLYAPFYVWNSVEGMNEFLCGDKFAGVTQSFGWPRVETWSVLRCGTASRLREARAASRESAPIAPFTALDRLRAEAAAWMTRTLGDGALAAVAAFEPGNWTMVRFALWERTPDQVGDQVQLFEVLHVSAPEAVPV